MIQPTEEQLAQLAIRLAVGRLLRLGSRPEQPGDAAQFQACRSVALEAAELLGRDTSAGYRPSYVRDRNKGAAGD